MTPGRTQVARAREWLADRRRSAIPPAVDELAELKRWALASPRYEPGTIELRSLRIRYVDLLSLYMEFKGIFGERIYHFDAAGERPRIIDGGGYIGLSMLYFKTAYPNARVTCFEPDPALFEVLEQNVRDNHLSDVELVRAGLASAAGRVPFVPDGADGGRIVEDEGAITVETVRLSDYVDDPVDFLKLNIEGFELPVLQEVGDKLRNVRELVLEYHGWPEADQRLGHILQLLDGEGFRYLVNHFDYETNVAVRPPFHLDRQASWFALVYAKRSDLV